MGCAMINMLLLPLVVVLATNATTSVLADDPSFSATERARIETVRTDETALSRSNIARAQAWGLSQTEWRRYQSLMQGIRGSGYRLATEAAADPMRSDLLGFPLPEAHRSLGPMSLQDALETLGGSAFRLVEDPLHRLVSFERCASLKRSPSNTRDPDRR